LDPSEGWRPLDRLCDGAGPGIVFRGAPGTSLEQHVPPARARGREHEGDLLVLCRGRPRLDVSRADDRTWTIVPLPDTSGRTVPPSASGCRVASPSFVPHAPPRTAPMQMEMLLRLPLVPRTPHSLLAGGRPRRGRRPSRRAAGTSTRAPHGWSVLTVCLGLPRSCLLLSVLPSRLVAVAAGIVRGAGVPRQPRLRPFSTGGRVPNPIVLG